MVIKSVDLFSVIIKLKYLIFIIIKIVILIIFFYVIFMLIKLKTYLVRGIGYWNKIVNLKNIYYFICYHF